MKTCRSCRISKLIDEFWNMISAPDGKQYVCKSCQKIKIEVYRTNNKQKLLDYCKRYRLEHPDEKKDYRRKRKILVPWESHFGTAKRRCCDRRYHKFKNYGGRGIKFLMTRKDVESLWFRDKAYQMKRPSIDRRDNDGNYTFENCRFIELLENIRRVNRQRRKYVAVS